VLRRASDCCIRQALQQSTPHGLRSLDVGRASGPALPETKEQSTTEATSRVLRAESPALSGRASTDTSSAIDPQATVIATQCPLPLPRESGSRPTWTRHLRSVLCLGPRRRWSTAAFGLWPARALPFLWRRGSRQRVPASRDCLATWLSEKPLQKLVRQLVGGITLLRASRSGVWIGREPANRAIFGQALPPSLKQ
jgi:hypothetical protein